MRRLPRSRFVTNSVTVFGFGTISFRTNSTSSTSSTDKQLVDIGNNNSVEEHQTPNSGVATQQPKQYWFTNIQRKLTPADPAMDQLQEIILNPTDPKGPAPPNLSPIPHIGTPHGGIVVHGPHEIANAPF